jgi:hypothetical protein
VTTIFRRILGLIPMATLNPTAASEASICRAPPRFQPVTVLVKLLGAKAMFPRLCPRRSTDGRKASEYLTSVGICYDSKLAALQIHGLRTISTIL